MIFYYISIFFRIQVLYEAFSNKYRDNGLLFCPFTGAKNRFVLLSVETGRKCVILKKSIKIRQSRKWRRNEKTDIYVKAVGAAVIYDASKQRYQICH